MDSQLRLDSGPSRTLATIPADRNSVRIMPAKVATSIATPATYGLPSPLESPAVPESTLEQRRQKQKSSLAAKKLAEIEEQARGLKLKKPISWSHFKKLVDTDDLGSLVRSYEVKIAYEHHKIKVLQHYDSMADYLQKNALADFIAETNLPGFDAASPITSSDFLFLRNDFPYHLEDDIEHWVLWCKKRLDIGYVAPEAAVQAIMRKFGHDIEWRYIVNPVHLQSVPQLSHAHVFIKHINNSSA
ncbi:hypothetical protein H4R20_006723 [Coemansia guatemalensis]|uniref:Uncharacterized protein n=1 Tax=Coemansia guatemalensis TaxID=2761395 RepID=A0A9W8HNX3_9FUNG|nr:hypothetical protein H4R20_006723 [Coemansia guatemalensis]